jgi:hypothetical protein
MMPNVRRLVANLVLFSGLTWGVSAHADEPANVSKAREIALAAGDDLDAGRFQEALEKISQAEALYHAPTHVVMRAEAFEGLGRLAEALDTYETLAAEPLSPTAPAAFKKAREDGRKRQVALIARVPSLLVLVSGPESSTIVATVDGKPIALAADQATRFDPGKHLLRIEAKGYRTVERTIELAERGGVVKVNIPLEKEMAQVAVPPPPPPPQPAPKGPTLDLPALATMGVGVAFLVAGTVTGAVAISRAKELEEQCAPDGRCPPSAQELIDTGLMLGNISTTTIIVGGVGLGAGIGLAVLGKSKPKAFSKQFNAVPWIAPGMVGLRGTF